MTRPVRWTTLAATQLQEAAVYLDRALDNLCALAIKTGHPIVFQ